MKNIITKSAKGLSSNLIVKGAANNKTKKQPPILMKVKQPLVRVFVRFLINKNTDSTIWIKPPIVADNIFASAYINLLAI